MFGAEPAKSARERAGECEVGESRQICLLIIRFVECSGTRARQPSPCSSGNSRRARGVRPLGCEAPRSSVSARKKPATSRDGSHGECAIGGTHRLMGPTLACRVKRPKVRDTDRDIRDPAETLRVELERPVSWAKLFLSRDLQSCPRYAVVALAVSEVDAYSQPLHGRSTLCSCQPPLEPQELVFKTGGLRVPRLGGWPSRSIYPPCTVG